MHCWFFLPFSFDFSSKCIFSLSEFLTSCSSSVSLPPSSEPFWLGVSKRPRPLPWYYIPAGRRCVRSQAWEPQACLRCCSSASHVIAIRMTISAAQPLLRLLYVYSVYGRAGEVGMGLAAGRWEMRTRLILWHSEKAALRMPLSIKRIVVCLKTRRCCTEHALKTGSWGDHRCTKGGSSEKAYAYNR